MGRVFQKLLTPLLASAAVAVAGWGCRDHEALCRGADCGATLDGQPQGDGGNGATSLGGAAGAGAGTGATGGAAPLEPSGCLEHADCDDQMLCNGTERCDDGACQPGTALSCTMGTRCVEAFGECRFPEPSPWLVVLSRGAVFGLPVAELGKRSLLPLGERDVASGFSGFVYGYVSPDSRRLWLHSYHGSFRDASMFSVPLGAGLPGPMTPVHDLPTVGSFVDAVFSPDGRHGFIEDEYSGLYLFDFSNEDPTRYRGRLLGVYEPDWYEEHGFCENSDLLVASGRVRLDDAEAEISDKSAWFIDSSGGTEIRETELGAGNTYLSSSGKLFALAGAEGVELIACDRSLARVPLAAGEWRNVAFAPGDRYVEVSNFDAYQIYSLARPSSPVLVYSCSDCEVEWLGAELIRVSGEGEDELLELQGDSPPQPSVGDLEEPLRAELAELVVARGSHAFLVQAPEIISAGGAGGAGGSDTSSEFGIVYRTDPEQVVPIMRQGSGLAEGSVEWSDVDRGLAIVSRSVDSSNELWLLHFAEPPFTEELVDSDIAIAHTAVSPDGRGFAYWYRDWDSTENSEVAWQPFARGAQGIPLGVTGEPMFGPLPP